MHSQSDYDILNCRDECSETQKKIQSGTGLSRLTCSFAFKIRSLCRSLCSFAMWLLFQAVIRVLNQFYNDSRHFSSLICSLVYLYVFNSVFYASFDLFHFICLKLFQFYQNQLGSVDLSCIEYLIVLNKLLIRQHRILREKKISAEIIFARYNLKDIIVSMWFISIISLRRIINTFFWSTKIYKKINSSIFYSIFTFSCVSNTCHVSYFGAIHFFCPLYWWFFSDEFNK